MAHRPLTNQMNIHRKKSIVVNQLFEELYAGGAGRKAPAKQK